MEQTGQAMQNLRSDLARALGELDRALVQARYPAFKDFLSWPSRDKVRDRGVFVGRDWVFDELAAFADRWPSGYLHVVADAGLGKTALAVAVANR